jgi:hypothetical protein
VRGSTIIGLRDDAWNGKRVLLAPFLRTTTAFAFIYEHIPL